MPFLPSALRKAILDVYLFFLCRGFCWLWLRLVLRYITTLYMADLRLERICIMFDFKILFALKSYLLLYYNKGSNISIVPCHLHYSVPFKKTQNVNQLFSHIHVRVAYLFLVQSFFETVHCCDEWRTFTSVIHQIS
jgi:hypothetical protein